jgi:hypothetical protein
MTHPATHAGTVPRLHLQRMIIRLLHDPSLLERDWRDEGLSDEEIGWLRAVDPRAWRADPYRGARLLTGLLEEFPHATAACAQDLRDFLPSPELHACVRDGGSLAAAFGAWLGRVGGARVAGLARMEAAVAACRRATHPTHVSDGTRLVVSKRCAVVAGPVGSPYDVDGHALVEVGEDGAAGVSAIPEALAALLEAAARPVAPATLIGRAMALGAERDEAAEIVDGLVADGLLVRA